MVWQGLLAKAAPTVVTGVVGVAAYEVVRNVIAKAPLREATVSGTALALRVARKAEGSAERARLTVADVFAEAAERVGGEVRPPESDPRDERDHQG